MKKINITLLLAAILLGLVSCNDYLDPTFYNELTAEQVFTVTTYVKSMPNAIYSCIPQQTGLGMSAGATDEAEYVESSSAMQLYNTGSWNRYSNPDDVWGTCYKGIRVAMDYLSQTDTITWYQWRYSNPARYKEHIRNLCIGRGDARFLTAYLYMELLQRYGEVPLITEKVEVTPDMDYSKFPRASVDDIVAYICQQCDIVSREGEYAKTQQQTDQMSNSGRDLLPVIYRDTLAMNYATTGEFAAYLGRATRASAYALKAKALIWYASPLFNPSNDVERWKQAAVACKKVIDLPSTYYRLEESYEQLFSMKSNWSKEFLFVRKAAASNSFEKENYPVSIEGGSTGVCPSQNLVDAYEVVKDGVAEKFSWSNPAHAASPYQNRDPRMYATVYTHGQQYNSTVNELVLDCTEGGNSGLPLYNASRTGYYLKKYVNPALDLKNNKTDSKTWILMRMAEFYLYYAEAMNEAYGPTDKGTTMMSATEALNKVRTRATMPEVNTSDVEEFREAVRHEREVELAFENKRWGDVRRWMIGQQFNKPLMGIAITTVDGATHYAPTEVEKRSFDESKMYLYPIMQSEIDRSQGSLQQNTNW